MSLDEMLAGWGEDNTLLGRLPTLAQVAETAVFLVSDRAEAITGAVVDLTSGNAVRNSSSFLIGVLDWERDGSSAPGDGNSRCRRMS